MKKLLFLVTTVLFIGQVNAQNKAIWQKTDPQRVASLTSIRPKLIEGVENYYTIDLQSMQQSLINAKDKFSGQPAVVVAFPNMNGEMELFNVWENSNFEADLQAKFPQIRAYVGKGITDKGATINFSVSPQGIQTMLFRTDAAAEFIEPYDKAATAYTLFNGRNRGETKLNCTTADTGLTIDPLNLPPNLGKSNNQSYKTMKLALSCTAEYSNSFGATSSAQQSLVVAAMNATMTRVNGVYEKDLSLHLNMIDNTTFIYYDPNTDPYSGIAGSDSNGNGFDDGLDNWNLELMNTLHVTPGDSAFDIGHLFGASGGGGNAGCIGCVCSNTTTTSVDSYGITKPNSYKGSGITSPPGSLASGDAFDIDFVAHEMGHQLGGNHSFTFGYEGTVAQVEPGSGSTIMGYAGVAYSSSGASLNVQSHSDPIFCYKNINQIQTNLITKSCPVSTSLAGTNAAPTANAGSDYTIPQGTAFVLTGTATDADAGDVLTYLWEQDDKGTNATTQANSFVLATKTVGPNFRTFKPSTKLERYFPQMGKIMAGTLAITTGSTSNWESVSTVARTLNFIFTARDNHAGMGQTQTDAMKVTVSTAGGPFAITSQTVAGTAYTSGTTQDITWSVANTTASPFNTTNVDIYITNNASTALETFNATTPTSPNPTTWTLLAGNVPNNGLYTATIPTVATAVTTCRFMVKAVGNVFLAVNSKNFTINPALSTNNVGGLDSFNLYPNPNNGSFTVSFNSKSENNIEVVLHDIRGRQIFNKSYTNTGLFEQNINLSNVQAGIYLVTVKDGSNKVVKKIIVE